MTVKKVGPEKLRISWGATAIRIRSGFTLIEVVVVTGIIVLFAALITPSISRLTEAQAQRDAVPAMLRMIQYARESAISNHTTAVLTFDNGGNQFTAKADDTTDPNAPVTSNLSSNQNPGGGGSVNGSNWKAPVTTPGANGVLFSRSLTVPQNLSFNAFRVGSQDVAAADFKLRFYPDGTCDGGAFEFSIQGVAQSIVINVLGRPTLSDGSLPDPNTIRWEAGQFEPRQNAQ